MEQIKKEIYWSRFAENFEEKQESVVGKEVITLMKNEILKQQPLGITLELGCGTGLCTESLTRVSDHVIATDFSDEMIAMARRKRGNLNQVDFKKADARDLEFPEGTFDTIFMANLIHVIGDAERVIRESRRVLKNEGLLIITSFALDELRFVDQLVIGLKYLATFGKPSKEATREKLNAKKLEEMLGRNGFSVLKSAMLGNRSKAYFITSRKRFSSE